MENVKEFAMANVARAIADENNKAIMPTVKLYADCGVTTITPSKTIELGKAVYDAFAVWIMAREEMGTKEELEENKALLKWYGAKARKAAGDWFILFATKPGRHEGDNARPFVSMDNSETAVIADIVGYTRAKSDINNPEKLAKNFCKMLMLETANLLDGKPSIRVDDETRKTADKAYNKAKRDKTNKTKSDNKSKLDETQDKLEKAGQETEQVKAEVSAMTKAIMEAIELVKKSSATELEKAEIIGKLMSAIASK